MEQENQGLSSKDLELIELEEIVDLKYQIKCYNKKIRKLINSARKQKTEKNTCLRGLIRQQQEKLYEKYNCDDCKELDKDIAELEQELHRLEQIEAGQRSTIKELVKQVKTKTETIGDLTHANIVFKDVVAWNRKSNPMARGSYRRKHLAEEAKRKEEEKKQEKRKEEKRKEEEMKQAKREEEERIQEKKKEEERIQEKGKEEERKQVKRKKVIKEQSERHTKEFKKILKVKEVSDTLNQPSTLARPSSSFLSTTIRRNGKVIETSAISRHRKEKKDKKKQRISQVPAAESKAMIVNSTKPTPSKEEKDKKHRMQ